LLESLKRRRLLQGLGLSALASRSYALKVAPANFTHGVASGDPLTDRIILWTRVLPMTSGRRVEVTWQVAEDSGFSRVITGGETGADAESDYTVKVDATGLVPGTDYFYRFSAQGQTSPVGRTKTLPTDRRGRVSYGSSFLLELSTRVL
jgi:alkaline phosphatase D